ncbi:MAG: hypothetical protein DWI22_10555 [Planctomycetota bacterium]|nr:MAG: hypothetical protein DWI22_10555 [Planctomycetota bacterium]
MEDLSSVSAAAYRASCLALQPNVREGSLRLNFLGENLSWTPRVAANLHKLNATAWLSVKILQMGGKVRAEPK